MAKDDAIDWYDDGATLTAEAPSAPPDDPDAFRWPRPRVLLAFATAFVLFCAGSWWLTHPGAVQSGFGGSGFYVEAPGSVLAIDSGVYYVVGGAAPSTYPLDSLRYSVDLRGQEDLVRVSYAVCERTGNGWIGSALITGGTGVGDMCSSLTPFVQGQPIDLATQQLLILAEPLTAEPFSIGPATATYRVGFRAQQLEMPGTIDVNQPPRTEP
jgi:hypothetical protein